MKHKITNKAFNRFLRAERKRFRTGASIDETRPFWSRYAVLIGKSTYKGSRIPYAIWDPEDLKILKYLSIRPRMR